MGLHPHDGIALLIEYRRSPQCFDRDVVLFDLLGGSFKILGANVGQHLRQIGSPMQYPGVQDCLQFTFLLDEAGATLHVFSPRLDATQYTRPKTRFSTPLTDFGRTLPPPAAER